MIIIRHHTGPLAGSEQRVEPKSDQVIFGRDAGTCDVVYPLDLTVISRRHFAFQRKPSGEWTFELFGDPYVAVNGSPADPEQAVHTGDVIELGRPGGPSFEVTLEDEALHDQLPRTEPHFRAPSAHAAADHAERAAAHAEKTAGGAKRFGLVGLALVVLVAACSAVFMYVTRRDLQGAMAAQSGSQARYASEQISEAVRKKALDSAHVVVLRDARGGEAAVATASPVAEDLLVTNAHVAVLLEEFKKQGGRLFVRSPGEQGKEYEVIEAGYHPAYHEFEKFRTTDPLYVVSYGGMAQLAPNISYDVGYLRVAKGSNLGPILEIATPEELAKVGAGTPIAVAGYPLDYRGGAEVQAIGATPTLYVGIITAMTDMFNLPGTPAQRRTIHHGLPTVGGSSGSAMLNGNGKLIGVNNAGTDLILGANVKIPTLDNFGQRIDLFTDLMSGRAAKTLDEERAYWKQQTTAFQREADIIPAILAGFTPKGGAPPKLISQDKFTFAATESRKDGNAKWREKWLPAKLAAGKHLLYVAHSEAKYYLQLYLVKNDPLKGVEILTSDPRPRVWAPYISYQAKDAGDANVVIMGPDLDIPITLSVYEIAAPSS